MKSAASKPGTRSICQREMLSNTSPGRIGPDFDKRLGSCFRQQEILKTGFEIRGRPHTPWHSEIDGKPLSGRFDRHIDGDRLLRGKDEYTRAELEDFRAKLKKHLNEEYRQDFLSPRLYASRFLWRGAVQVAKFYPPFVWHGAKRTVYETLNNISASLARRDRYAGFRRLQL